MAAIVHGAPWARPDRPRVAPPRTADHILPVGAQPRLHVDLSGYRLDSYTWSEKTGIARFTYRHVRSAKRLLIDVPQPAGEHQSGWSRSPIHAKAANDPTVKARYFESQTLALELVTRNAYTGRFVG